LLELAGAAAVSIVAAVVMLRLWQADLRVPFDYHDDGLYFGMMVKSTIEHGWFLTNPSLGAPGVLAMHDFPSAEGFHLLVVKVMSLCTSDWALIFNLYFLLGFPLITLSALAVFRHFRVGYLPALAASVLYAFLPRRLITGEAHYFLDIYYQVPLAILVALWTCSADPPLSGTRGAPRAGGGPGRGRTVAAIAICALTSATGIYDAFFAGVLILLGGLWASVVRRTARNALAGLVLTGVILAGLGLQAAPNLIAHRRDGPNAEVATRHAGEAEVFGLRIAQLLLPVTEHRVPALREIKRRYDALAPFPGETSANALGVAGSVGFLALIALLFLPAKAGPERELPRALAGLNLLALLVATVGGAGSLFALLVTPQLRAYGRMQVFVAFFSLFATALLLERAGRRAGRLAAIIPAVVLVVGLLDQVTPLAIKPYRQTRAEYARDDAFVKQIEATLPREAMIFELPLQSFPEPPVDAPNRVPRYDLLRPYFHSRALRWSYPAMAGRSADVWARAAAGGEPPELLRRLAEAGFDGLLIDRRGYDDPWGFEEALGAEIGGPPAVSADRRLSFFDLRAYDARALAGVPAPERERRRDLAIHPLYPRFVDGFYAPEQGPDGIFRWCGATGEIEIDNDAQTTRRATMAMTLAPVLVESSMLLIRGDLWSESVEIEPTGTQISKTLEIPPGRHFIHFQSKGRALESQRDPRRLVWQADNLVLKEEEPRDP
jgi:phosphoglycerol transferase